MMTDYKDTEKETRDLITGNNVFEFIGDPEPFSWCTRKNGITCAMPHTRATVKKIKRADLISERNAVDEVIYDVEYIFNEEGMRQQYQNAGANKHALFFGDSLTFGEGLKDEETLPYLFQQHNDTYQSYNYGFLGQGPGHMLLRVSTPEFKRKFKDKKGTVFYLYRDDAVKITAGKVPWCDGFPNYVLKDGEIIQDGEMPQSILEQYLPSQYTDPEFELTAEIFKKVKKEIQAVSKDLQLKIVLLPLSFSGNHMCQWLNYLDIDYTNLFYTDLEYQTGTRGLQLDGAFTKEANEVLCKKLFDANNDHTFELNDLDLEMELAGYSMPSFIHFPPDDAGVFIAQIFRKYEGDRRVMSGTEYYMDKLKTIWNEKQELLKHIKEMPRKPTKEELKTLSPVLKRNRVLLDVFYEEYV